MNIEGGRGKLGWERIRTPAIAPSITTKGIATPSPALAPVLKPRGLSSLNGTAISEALVGFGEVKLVEDPESVGLTELAVDDEGAAVEREEVEEEVDEPPDAGSVRVRLK